MRRGTASSAFIASINALAHDTARRDRSLDDVSLDFEAK
jgi:hypothetical protein